MRGVVSAGGRRALGRLLLFVAAFDLVWMGYDVVSDWSKAPVACGGAFGCPYFPSPLSNFPVASGIVIAVVCFVAAFLIYPARRSSAYAQ